MKNGSLTHLLWSYCQKILFLHYIMCMKTYFGKKLSLSFFLLFYKSNIFRSLHDSACFCRSFGDLGKFGDDVILV